MKVQKFVNNYLKKNPMMIQDLAKKVGVSQPTISRIISEDVSISDKILKKMVKAKVVTKEQAIDLMFGE